MCWFFFSYLKVLPIVWSNTNLYTIFVHVNRSSNKKKKKKNYVTNGGLCDLMKVRYVIYVLLTKKRNRFYRLLYIVTTRALDPKNWGRIFVKFASLGEC